MGTQKYPATTLTFNYSVQLTDTQQLVTNPALYNYMGYTDQKANDLASAQRKQDIASPAGTAAAEASETYMVQGGFLTPVVSVDALLFATADVDGPAVYDLSVVRSDELEAGQVKLSPCWRWPVADGRSAPRGINEALSESRIADRRIAAAADRGAGDHLLCAGDRAGERCQGRSRA